MSADNWANCPKCRAVSQFREDYEIGMYDDEFFVSYRGACRECGHRYFFDHTDPGKGGVA